jgi:hypothetical protein
MFEAFERPGFAPRGARRLLGRERQALLMELCGCDVGGNDYGGRTKNKKSAEVSTRLKD